MKKIEPLRYEEYLLQKAEKFQQKLLDKAKELEV
jgi:hypothetical protein